MLADMRERGSTDAKIKELVTPENYDRYKTIARPMTEGKIKSYFAIKTIGQQQGLMVSRDEVDEEIMTLQAQSLQRGEKFKESEVRPRVVQTHATLNLVDPKEESVEEMLGASPEELAATMTG